MTPYKRAVESWYTVLSIGSQEEIAEWAKRYVPQLFSWMELQMEVMENVKDCEEAENKAKQFERLLKEDLRRVRFERNPYDTQNKR